MPTQARRWEELVDRWSLEKRAKRHYEGRSGDEAVRFLGKVPHWIRAPPERVSEADLWTIVGHLGPAPKTKRTYLAILGSFLSWCGNWVVQTSRIRDRFPNRPSRTPVATAVEWEAVMDHAVGVERVVVAYLWPRRPVELCRALARDVHLDRGTMDIRQKGGHGEVTDFDLPLSGTLARELTWYLPLRAKWSEESESDSGHLVCRKEGTRLVGVSKAYIDRQLSSACRRVGVTLPAYSFRRGGLTTLRERGAEWEDVRDLAGHRSLGTTEGYVRSLLQRRRLPATARLLDPVPMEAR